MSLLCRRLAFFFSLSLLLLPVSCNKQKPGPRQVYEKWSAAISRNDCRNLYPLLDEKSRWAVMSAAKDTARAAVVIQKSYPEDRRSKELSKLGVQVADGKPETYFESICRRDQYPRRLAATVGKIESITVTGNRAVVVTDKKAKVLLTKDQYGRWGCTALKDQVVRRQLVAANFLKMVEQNARSFHKTNSVGGSAETN